MPIKLLEICYEELVSYKHGILDAGYGHLGLGSNATSTNFVPCELGKLS